MLNEDISKALGDISDDLLLGAMCVPEKRKHRRFTVVASLAAACLLLLPLVLAILLRPVPQSIQTAPGVITVLAHSLDEEGNPSQTTDVLTEGKLFRSETQKDGTDNQIFPLSFQVNASLYPGMELRMRVYTTAGIFAKSPQEQQSGNDLPQIQRYLMNYYGQEYEIEIGQNVYWQTDGFDYLYMEEQLQKGNFDFTQAYRNHDFKTGPAYIHVILRADGHLVGFCRIRITLTDESAHRCERQFCFQVVTSVSFPQVDGQWQEVGEEELRELLRKDMARLQDELD